MFVMIPNGMTSGGLPGVTRMITHIFPWDYSLVYYSISMVIVITAWITMGKRELERIIALAITYPILLFIFEHIDFQLLDSEDRLLASLIMGVFYGLASGIGYVGGYSSGGTDTLARVLKYKLFNFLRVADIKLVIDVTIIIISALTVTSSARSTLFPLKSAVSLMRWLFFRRNASRNSSMTVFANSGLDTKASTPMAFASSAISSQLKDVSMMTGVSFPTAERMRRVVSRPSISGMRQSTRMRL
jgi:uncharacterized membrane-anchored protein YitT (DUF2179 family)